MKQIYLDHAATSPVHPQVVEAMLPFFSEHFGNPSSVHRFGREAKAALVQGRKEIASVIGAQPEEIIFTSGGTEADNLAILGTAFAYQGQGKHLITTQIEHHAVLQSFEYLQKQGFDVTYLPVDECGQISLDDLTAAIREDTILVSIMYANNEIGSIQPIAEIANMLAERQIIFHTDAVQAFGSVAFNVEQLPVDLLSVSGHKINGPKGIGFLYKRKNVQLTPLFHGGSQERKLRAGTENIPAVQGLAKATRLAYEQLQEKEQRYTQFRQLFLDVLDNEGIDYHVNGHRFEYVAHILNLSFPAVRADVLLANLDLEGIAVSSGSACTAGSLQPSHVLEAMFGHDLGRVQSAIRFSFGYGNTLEEIEQAAQICARIVKRLGGRGNRRDS